MSVALLDSTRRSRVGVRMGRCRFLVTHVALGGLRKSADVQMVVSFGENIVWLREQAWDEFLWIIHQVSWDRRRMAAPEGRETTHAVLLRESCGA